MEHETLRDAERKLLAIDALADIVTDKPLKEVSVADVCQKAELSRSAFYRMFSGIQDAVLWHRNYGAELGLYQIGRTLTCYEGHLVSVSLIAAAKPLYAARASSKAGDEAVFRGATTRGHVQAMSDVLTRRCISISPRIAYTLEGVAASCYATVAHWIANGMDLSADEFAGILADAYPARLREVFDRPLTPNTSTAVMRLLGAMGQ